MSEVLNTHIQVITVVQAIALTCPHCSADLKYKYQEFKDITGEICDWKYSEIECTECDGKIRIDHVEWP